MRLDTVWRATRRAFAFGAGLCVAAGVFAGAQALAETGPATTTAAAADSQLSLAIEPESGYHDAVMQLAMRAISNRGGDPYFAASDIVTREQLAVYIARALWLPDVPALAFGDVGAADWGYKDIGAVADAGIMPGTSATTFSPDAPVSRQEAMAVTIAALKHMAAEKGTDLGVSLEGSQASDWLAGFQDRNIIGPQYFAAVAVAYRLGLFDHPAEGWLFPKLGITHQELVGMLDRALVEPLVSKAAVAAVAVVPAVDTYPRLSKGSKGSLVLLLQQRLNAMTYYSGTPDGKYSSQTRDAVYAFQKYQRLKRTGVVDATDWDAFWAASAPAPVYTGAGGRRVEVDLTRQVMMLIRDNKVVMTIHVSTGRYGTPTGNWHIRTRSHGWRPTSLGPIYSPAYFMAKNAIHGYPSVPLHPASHGCIRTPIWIEDEIVDELEMDELVHVFYNKAK
jgi:peptidoglycan hydrolase-like protein with peptidoglycan-binding domain